MHLKTVTVVTYTACVETGIAASNTASYTNPASMAVRDRIGNTYRLRESGYVGASSLDQVVSGTRLSSAAW